MLERIRKIREDKKGFTLVELIVVLVILAILAALLVPALTKYIDKAKDKQIIAETRQIVMATQTLIDERYAALPADTQITLTPGASPTDGSEKSIIGTDEIAELADMAAADVSKNLTVSKDDEELKISSAGKLEVLTWTNGKKCIFKNGKYTVTKAD